MTVMMISLKTNSCLSNIPGCFFKAAWGLVEMLRVAGCRHGLKLGRMLSLEERAVKFIVHLPADISLQFDALREARSHPCAVSVKRA